MSAEIELKLEVAPEAVPALLESEPLKSRGVVFQAPKHMVTTYYDTHKRNLARKDVFLRIRQDGERIIQTVKTAGEGGLLADRGEWDWPLEVAVPDLSITGETGLKVLEKREKKGGLVPLFASDINRRVALLNGGESELELALDQGVVRAGRRSSPVSEMEIEVKAGSVAPLFVLARELVQLRGVRVGFMTKAGRGFALADGTSASAVKASEAVLTPEMSTLDAAAAILNGCAAQAAGNMPLIVSKRLPEAVHQLRVSMRRLKAALALFKEQIPKARRKVLKEECSWLTDAVGAARDLDVMTMETIKSATTPEGLENEMGALKRALTAARKVAWAQAIEAAASPRAALLLLEMTETAHEMRAELPDPLATPLTPFAHDALDARLENVIAHGGPDLDKLTVDERHEMRLALKKMRYAADFFGDLFPAKAVKHGLKALARLQDSFGGFNDAAVAGTVLGKVAAVAPAKQRDGVERTVLYVTGWAAHRGAGDWAKARQAWENFRDEPPFWR